MKLPYIYLLCALILVGCALPLSREPDMVTEQAATDDSDSSANSRSLAVETSAEKAESGQGESEQESIAQAEEESANVAPLSASGTSEQANPTQAPAGDVSADADGEVALTMAAASLDLAALDRTFLESISEARGEVGPLLEHRFIQVVDARSVEWQGEALISEIQTVILMQPMEAGGQSAVRIALDTAQIMAGDTIAVDSLNTHLVDQLATAEIDLPDPDRFGPPDSEILLVRARETAAGVWNFDVRLNHPDTGWEDYTDGWHVETVDGQILGVRILGHPHVNEMPFMRSQSGIEIPTDVTEVQVRSHDLVSGYGVETVVVPITESGSGKNYEVTK